MKLKILLILLIPLLTSSCSFFYKTKEKATDDIFLVKRSPRAIIIDFYNLSKNAKYNDISFQISERLHKDLNDVFSIYDPSYTREFIKSKEYTPEQTYKPAVAGEIGKDSNADIVIRGMYNVIGNEIQVVGEIISLTEQWSGYDIKFTSPISTFLSSLDVYSIDFKSSCMDNFPAVVENTKEKIEKEAENKVTSPILVSELVDKSMKNEPIKTGKPAIDDPFSIEYENPSPSPDWLKDIPKEPGKIYFVGQAFEGDDYQSTLELAIQDAYYQMSQAIGQKVESTYTKVLEMKTTQDTIDVKERIIKTLLVETMSNVRNAERQQVYYCRRLKTKKYEVAVLYSIERAELEKLIAESVVIETKRAEKEKIEAETKLVNAQNEAEKNEIKKEIRVLQTRVIVYETIIKEKDKVIEGLEQKELKVAYEPHDEIVYTPSNQTEEKLNYYSLGWVITSSGIAFTGVGGILLGIASSENSAIQDNIILLAANPTLSFKNSIDNDISAAGFKERLGWGLLSIGITGICTGVFFTYFFEDIYYGEDYYVTLFPFRNEFDISMSFKW